MFNDEGSIEFNLSARSLTYKQKAMQFFSKITEIPAFSTRLPMDHKHVLN